MAAKKLNIIGKLVEEMPEQDKRLVLAWSLEAKTIVDDETLSRTEKLKKLRSMESVPAVKTFIFRALNLFKAELWDKRSWAGRLALSGLAFGITVAGGEAAGIAAFGTAIGIEVFLLTSAGGALLGTIIDESQKAVGKKE